MADNQDDVPLSRLACRDNEPKNPIDAATLSTATAYAEPSRTPDADLQGRAQPHHQSTVEVKTDGAAAHGDYAGDEQVPGMDVAASGSSKQPSSTNDAATGTTAATKQDPSLPPDTSHPNIGQGGTQAVMPTDHAQTAEQPAATAARRLTRSHSKPDPTASAQDPQQAEGSARGKRRRASGPSDQAHDADQDQEAGGVAASTKPKRHRKAASITETSNDEEDKQTDHDGKEEEHQDRGRGKIGRASKARGKGRAGGDERHAEDKAAAGSKGAAGGRPHAGSEPLHGEAAQPAPAGQQAPAAVLDPKSSEWLGLDLKGRHDALVAARNNFDEAYKQMLSWGKVLQAHVEAWHHVPLDVKEFKAANIANTIRALSKRTEETLKDGAVPVAAQLVRLWTIAAPKTTAAALLAKEQAEQAKSPPGAEGGAAKQGAGAKGVAQATPGGKAAPTSKPHAQKSGPLAAGTAEKAGSAPVVKLEPAVRSPPPATTLSKKGAVPIPARVAAAPGHPGPTPPPATVLTKAPASAMRDRKGAGAAAGPLSVQADAAGAAAAAGTAVPVRSFPSTGNPWRDKAVIILSNALSPLHAADPVDLASSAESCLFEHYADTVEGSGFSAAAPGLRYKQRLHLLWSLLAPESQAGCEDLRKLVLDGLLSVERLVQMDYGVA